MDTSKVMHGDLIAKISGQTFEAYMKEHILLPAGMSSSTFLLEEVARHRVDSYLYLAHLYLQKSQRAQMEACLLKALSIEPGNTAAAGLLEKVRLG